jgi:hypothetical protein
MDDFRISRRTAVTGLAVEMTLATTSPRITWTKMSERGNSESGLEIDLAAFGVSPGATPQENRIHFQRAVEHAPEGATLRLPPTGQQACAIDTSGGWSKAVQINRSVILRIDGNLKATHSSMRPDPPFILNVTAPGVRIIGNGRVIGDGTIDDANIGTDELYPGLIRVAADDFTLTGIELVAPPKVGLMLYQCRRARVQGARFSGGPRVYGDTGHFAIRAPGGGDHLFEGNAFYPDADGGTAVQCIMLVNSHDNVVRGNHALRPYEKLIYCFGDRNTAEGNTVVGNPEFVPDTNVQGTITAVFRFHGTGNTVAANSTHLCAGGAQMMDGTGHSVVGNRFLSCGQSAITVYQSDLSGTTISGNVCTRGNLVGFVAGDGIRLVADGAANGLRVEDNEIIGFSVADPIMRVMEWQSRAPYGRNSLVKPSSGNGRYYIAATKGVSAAQEPEWPDAPDTRVSDGTIEWVTMPYEGGQAEIKLIGLNAASPVSDTAIVGNTIRGGRVGIVTRFVTNSRIYRNSVEVSQTPFVEEAGSGNLWDNAVTRAAEGQVRRLPATTTEPP